MLQPKQSNIELSNFPEINVTDLPSNFKSYPSDAIISYRPYSFGEINRVSQSNFSYKQVIDEVLKGVKTSFNIYELTFADYLYIALLRKLLTLGGNKFVVQYRCERCGSIRKFESSIDKIDFDDLRNIPQLPIVINLGEKELHFTPLTINDYITLLSKKLENDIIAGLAIQIRNIKFDEAYKIIDNCNNIEDMNLLNEVDSMLFHGIKPISIICDNVVKNDDNSMTMCGNKVNLSLDGGEVLLLPFRTDSTSERNRIHFGK